MLGNYIELFIYLIFLICDYWKLILEYLLITYVSEWIKDEEI